jgi:transcription elongation factor GreA
MRLADEMLMTEEGWTRLRDELAGLRARHQERLAEHLEHRRDAEYGDRSLDYQPNEVVSLGRRIAELEAALAHAVVVGEADREPGKVGVGSWVAVRWDDDYEESFVLVGPLEVDSPNGRISYESPVGKAVLGRSKGEVVEAKTPAGSSQLQVLAVR